MRSPPRERSRKRIWKPDETEPFHEEDRIGKLWKFFFSVKGKLIEILGIETEAESGLVFSVVIGFEGMIDHVHPLHQDVFSSGVVKRIACV